MASVDDRWYVLRTLADGTEVREPSARHGVGKRWQVRWRNAQGLPRKLSFDRKPDADREAARITVELARGTYIDPNAGEITFREYAERWRTTQFSDPSTEYQVEIRLRLHVYPALGELRLRKITPSHLRDWLGSLTMSRTYQHTIFANVSQILSAAVADNLIGRNPCRSRTLRPPRPDPVQVVPWPGDQVAAVHAALPEPYAIVVPLAAGTGLRQGEILGLSPADIDRRRRTITVRRQVKLTPGNRAYLAPPKGRKTRSVPLPDTVLAALDAHLTRHPARTVTLPWDGPDGAPVTLGLVLTTRESTPVNRHYFNAKIWKPALRVAGVPATRDNGCHALRHFYASVLLDGGESIRTVSDRLGHADPGFTLRTYTHLLPETDTRTRGIIDTALPTWAGRGPNPSASPAPVRSTGPTRARRPPGPIR